MTKLRHWPGATGLRLFCSPNNYAGPTVSPGRYLNIDQGTRLVPWQLFISIVTLTLINKLIQHYYAHLASGGSLRYRKYLDTDFTFIKPTMPSLPALPTYRAPHSLNVLTFHFSFRWAFRVIVLVDGCLDITWSQSHPSKGRIFARKVVMSC